MKNVFHVCFLMLPVFPCLYVALYNSTKVTYAALCHNKHVTQPHRPVKCFISVDWVCVGACQCGSYAHLHHVGECRSESGPAGGGGR